jgi:hypothetical protein
MTDLELLLGCIIICILTLLQYYFYRFFYTKEKESEKQKSENLPGAKTEKIIQPDDFVLNWRIEVLDSSLPADSWCRIDYFELNSKVGRTFKAKSANKTITVDGSSSPGNIAVHFSLDQMSNINRSLDTEEVRRNIGNGAELIYTDGNLRVKCLSEKPIFVQSLSMNHRFGWHPETVTKLPSQCWLDIFNKNDFIDLLNVAAGKGYDDVNKLSQMCFIKLSFVKGWGTEFRIQEVRSVPCWIEITLLQPLEMIDKVITRMALSY